jgi:hypothetical protein
MQISILKELFLMPVLKILVLSALMLITRGSHFSGINALPEASWMIFMAAGTLLPTWSFAWFMSLAIGIDAYAFTFGGVPGTCFSIAYGMLIPAYFSMWIAGRLAKPYFTGNLSGSALFFGFAMAGTLVCELISSGSFYLWSGNFEPTFAEFVSRELAYAPAAFSSSAYWAVALIVGTTAYRLYQQAKAPNALTH